MFFQKYHSANSANPTYGTIFSNLSGKVHARRGHENCCCFATPQGVHQRVRSRVEHFRIDPTARVTAELRNAQQEKNGGRGASSRGFVRGIGFLFFCFVGDATQVDRLPFESLKPPFPLHLRAFEALFHPRTEKNVISLNLVPSKRKATKEIQHEIVEKITKKCPFFSSPATKTDPPQKSPSANWTRTFFGPYGQKRCGGRKRAAHPLLFVVRWADLSGKWCNRSAIFALSVLL